MTAPFLAVLLVLASGSLSAQTLGDRDAQDKGDVVFRSLGFPYSGAYHSAIYNEYSDPGTSTGTPQDLTKHSVIEMTGITGAVSDSSLPFPHLRVSSISLISQITLQSFEHDGHHQYWGAYTPSGKVLFRGTVSGNTSRAAIVECAKQLKNRPVTPVQYAVAVNDPVWPNIVSHYASASGAGATVEVADINTLRSDAFVEYCYASITPRTPIVGASIYLRSGLNYLQRTAELGGLTPTTQLLNMMSSLNIPPAITVFNGTTTIPSGGATSLTSLSVTVDAVYSGPARLELYRDGGLVAVDNPSSPRDVNTYTYTSSDISELGSLQNASYSLRAIDQAGNASESVGFTIDTQNPDPKAVPGSGSRFSTDPITNNQCIVLSASENGSGICRMWSDFFPGTATFSGASIGAYVLSVCNVSSGTYVVYAEDCAGNIGSRAVSVTSAAVQMVVAGSGAGWSQTNSVAVPGSAGFTLDFSVSPAACNSFTLTLEGTTTSCASNVFEGTLTPGKSASWELKNITLSSVTAGMTFTADLGGYTAQLHFNAPPAPYTLPPGGSLSGSITIPESIATLYSHSFVGSTLTVTSPYNSVYLSTRAALTVAEESARLRQVLRQSGYIVDVTADGGVGVFASTMSLSLAYTDTAVDTTTARIYRLDGSTWESDSMFAQSVVRTGNDVLAIGVSTFTSTFVVFFDGQDSSAPVTTFSIQGSSFVFDQALFVSTDSYVVLIATDPAVGGYASTVSSINYRIDPSSGSPFYIYSSSIPLPLGTHVFEYSALDYAGNAEAVKTATFTVTAGTAFRTTNTAQVPGVLLNGFLGTGAKLEVESQAQNSLTLLISSVNRQAMVSVDNIGEVGIGVTPQANLNIGADAIGLQLRSGNSTSSVTSAQIAFGYNGDSSMSHFLRTEHSTSTDGNKMDFLVWNTGAGSTTTVANLHALSLQGIKTASGASFHVQPVGEPDAEVEVSNGLTTGGGTMQRADWVLPSSRRFKTDIKDLAAKDEDRALAEVVGLKHARFRYKSRREDGRLAEDPGQPLRTGLIYEEAPDSIRDGDGALSTSERLVNVELALKASIRRLEELQQRYDKLKARK